MTSAIRKFYSVQSAEAWINGERTGILSADERYICPDFIPSYLWMMEQMKKSISNYKDEFPIWMWPERPDLRRYMHQGMPGGNYVLVQIYAGIDRVLGSDFDAWHYVLNNWTLAFEHETINRELSWNRIFDYEFLKKFDGRKIKEQFVTGNLDMSDIRLLTSFEIKKT